MLEEIILENYGIVVEQKESNSRYPTFKSNNVIYSIIPLEKIEWKELAERQQMSEHLKMQGDRYVSTFVMAKHGSYVSEVDEQAFVLLENDGLQPKRTERLGRHLGIFHARGRSINETISACSRIGQWKNLWETRIDQLEKLWSEKVQAHPNNEFEQLFIDTFPYYMALGENAVQYLVDTEIDDSPEAIDSGTICYERFHQNTWSGEEWAKNPFDWVFDHGTRDIAEWVRDHYFRHVHTHQRGVTEFLREYQSIERLSSFSVRLLYARLLFPVHYFETVAEFFSTAKESRSRELEDTLASFIKTSQYYERFLKNFYNLAEIPIKQMQIPELDWL